PALRILSLVMLALRSYAIFFFPSSSSHRHLPSFPTRRSSDLFIENLELVEMKEARQNSQNSLARLSLSLEGMSALSQPRHAQKRIKSDGQPTNSLIEAK